MKPGTSVVITDRSGDERRGRVTAVSATSLTLRSRADTRDLAPAEIGAIRRDGDPLWNGIAIGGAVGVVGAMLPDARYGGTPPRVVDREIPQRIAFAAAATGLGALIDALHRDKSTIYRRSGPPATLFLAPPMGQGRGVFVGIRVPGP